MIDAFKLHLYSVTVRHQEHRLRHTIPLIVAALLLSTSLAACGRLGAEPTASPPPEYLCDVVPTKTLREVMLLDPGQGNTAAYVHHHADFAPNSDGWLCLLSAPEYSQKPGLHQEMRLEYTSNSIWNTPRGRGIVSPLEQPDPEAQPFTLPGHEGEGWTWEGYAPLLAWHYPSGYYLLISMSYGGDVPTPDDRIQALKDLAATILDDVPAAAANPTSTPDLNAPPTTP